MALRPTGYVRLPLYLVVVLLVALAVNAGRGYQLARRHNESLKPWRTTAVLVAPPGSERVLTISADQRFALLPIEASAGERIVLHQIFPERTVLRWLEEEARRAPWLVVPLAGLDRGEYGLAWAGPDELAGAMEADGPVEQRAWIVRFRLERP